MSHDPIAEENHFVHQVRELAPLIAASVGEIDATRDIPAELFEQLVERGLFRLLQPKAIGGAQLTPPEFVRVLEEAAKHDASTAWCLGQNNVCSTVSAYLEPHAASAMFASPRDILAWGPGPGEARVSDGGYVLNGQFSFASGSRHATWLGAHVPVIEADGARRTASDGSPGSFTMLFPRDKASVTDNWHVLGMRGTGSDSFSVEDVFIPQQMTIARDYAIKPRLSDPLYVFTSSTLYSSGFAAVALGMARATFDAFTSAMRDTIPRGASRSRGANNVVQTQVGQAEAKLRSARMFLLGSLDDVWAGVQANGTMSDEQRLSLRLSTTWAIQQSREVISALYLSAGSAAIFESGPFERRFRDIHTLCQQIQGHAAHFETVGQILMGMEPDRPMFTF